MEAIGRAFTAYLTSALRRACFSGRVMDAQHSVDGGADIEAIDEFGGTPLIISSRRGHVGVATLLLDRGASIDRLGKYGTALHAACGRGYSRTAMLLLDRGADVEGGDGVGDGRGVSPLFSACCHGHIGTATLLLDRGAAVGRSLPDGRTALHVASQEGQVDAVQLLLDRGIDLHGVDREGETAFCTACQAGQVDVATLLLDRGAEVDRADHYGVTPIWTACSNGHIDVVRLCIQRGASSDRVIYVWNNWTPLFAACAFGHVDLVRLLLNQGSEINRTADGKLKTAHAIAEHNGHTKMASWLEHVLASGWTRHLSAPRYQLVVLKELVARGRAQRRRAAFKMDHGRALQYVRMLDLLFPVDPPPRDQPRLPDALFAIIAWRPLLLGRSTVTSVERLCLGDGTAHYAPRHVRRFMVEI
mmetsp:Transcript_14779/g.45827  ORF Transcript_14779/g.45827 Transcript_14779/m.45827 type:complete len:417 (-) Transcript_14779:40-1290(-)